MIQEITAYEKRVCREICSLQERVGGVVSHNGEGWCPSCGHWGVFDLQGVGLAAGSIFFSTALEKWCCMACEIETTGY